MAVYVPHQVRQGGTLCKRHFGACFFSSAFRSCSAPARRAPCRVIWGFSGWSAISVFPRAPARSGSVAVTGISPCFAGFREWRLLRTAGVLRLSCRASLHFWLFVACMLDCSSERLSSGQPSFSEGFRVFWIATRKCVCVCVCVCVWVCLCVVVSVSGGCCALQGYCDCRAGHRFIFEFL